MKQFLSWMILLVFLITGNRAQAGTYLSPATGSSSTTTQIISTATTYYVCAKGAGGTCVYNGDAGTVATPSNSNECTTKALPCATIAGVASLLNGKILAAIVTIQLADTAGTGTDCYTPNNTIFNVSTLTKQIDTQLEAGEGGSNVYPSIYFYLLANVTTPNNVILTGATTCAGTTASVYNLLRFSNVDLRVRGLKIQYIASLPVGPDAGAINISNGHAYFEDVNGVGDPTQQAFLFGVNNHSVARLGSSVGSTVSNIGVVDVYNLSHVSTATPLGRYNLTLTGSGAWNPPAAFILCNEKSHCGIDGMSISATSTTTGTATLMQSIASSSITWNDNSTFTAPTQTWSVQGNWIVYKAIQDSSINDGCRGVGSLICNIGTVTPVNTYIRADLASRVFYNQVPVGATTLVTVLRGSTVVGPLQSVFSPTSTTFANLGAPGNGTMTYCTDCNATCTAGGGTGRTCFRENGAWTH